MSPQITDKHGQPINKGDHVYTPFRGGRHEGDAEQIVTTDDEARQAKVKKPPKVVFTDQNDKRVVHNPETLENQSKVGNQQP